MTNTHPASQSPCRRPPPDYPERGGDAQRLRSSPGPLPNSIADLSTSKTTCIWPVSSSGTACSASAGGRRDARQAVAPDMTAVEAVGRARATSIAPTMPMALRSAQGEVS